MKQIKQSIELIDAVVKIKSLQVEIERLREENLKLKGRIYELMEASGKF